jgi:hypothetical protein
MGMGSGEAQRLLLERVHKTERVRQYMHRQREEGQKIPHTPKPIAMRISKYEDDTRQKNKNTTTTTTTQEEERTGDSRVSAPAKQRIPFIPSHKAKRGAGDGSGRGWKRNET